MQGLKSKGEDAINTYLFLGGYEVYLTAEFGKKTQSPLRIKYYEFLFTLLPLTKIMFY